MPQAFTFISLHLKATRDRKWKWTRACICVCVMVILILCKSRLWCNDHAGFLASSLFFYVQKKTSWPYSIAPVVNLWRKRIKVCSDEKWGVQRRTEFISNNNNNNKTVQTLCCREVCRSEISALVRQRPLVAISSLFYRCSCINVSEIAYFLPK